MEASRRYQGGRLACACVLLLAIVPARANASAHDAKEPIHFEYVAPPECPPAERFLGQIAAFTTRWSVAEAGENARRFIVRIAPRDGAFVGHLEVREASGNATDREIEGATCNETALGVAVAVALAIDPAVVLGPSSPPASEPTPTREPATAAPPPKDERVAQSAPVAAETTKRPSSAFASAPSSSPVALAVGARGEANGAVSGVLAVLDLFVELEWVSPWSRVPSLRPAVRGGWRHAFERTASVGRSRADIGWSAGYLEICPARFGLTGRFTIEGCGGANLGVLSAQLPEIRGADVTRRTWFDYGFGVGARWQAHPNVFVEAVTAVWAPLTRDRLRIEPDGVVSRAPAAGISAGVGGGWRF